MLCRHCGVRRANRPRGLCWKHYYTPGVRDRYPPVGDGRFLRRGVLDFNGPPPAPTVPTAALPGTAEKLAVLAGRAAAGLQLFHPLDGFRAAVDLVEACA